MKTYVEEREGGKKGEGRKKKKEGKEGEREDEKMEGTNILRKHPVMVVSMETPCDGGIYGN